jgi:hypothetical protein
MPNYPNYLCFVSLVKFKSMKLHRNVDFKAKNIFLKAKNVCLKAKKRFANIFVKFCENFAIMKLPSSFDRFDNFEIGRVSCKLSAF